MIWGFEDYRRGGSILSASSEQSAFPAAALLRSRLSDPWRAAVGVTSATIAVDLSAAVGACSLVTVPRVLVADNGTARLEASNSSIFSSLVWDSTTVPAISAQGIPLLPAGHQLQGRTVVFSPPSVTARYWRLTLSGLPAAGVLGAALLSFWRAWQGPDVRAWSPVVEVDEVSLQTRRRVRVVWPELLDDDVRAKLEGVLTQGRGYGRLFVAPAGLAAVNWDALYCVVQPGSVAIDHVLTHQGARWNVAAELVEVID
jgi:hypothetical protein